MSQARYVKDLMLPLDDYAVVQEDATLIEAYCALVEARKKLPPDRPPSRAVLVTDKKGKIVGKVGQLAFLDVSGRVARTLLEMCDTPEAMSHPDGTQIHISRQEIARNVGCSREMAGRVLRSLEEQGMIQAHGMDIVVLHPR